ncbi:hypothetical protein K2173_019093 [Erythroxylum novogranatense]|uniref:SANTA domain-containing protein n=1 Tax=Erythroxylum novogranatense TaxID=1862640 RepID=A0AAV8STP7_9ROSI|nr:hypothetical protein K2173_019093 [Erythroxylum novogranatense]
MTATATSTATTDDHPKQRKERRRETVIIDGQSEDSTETRESKTSPFPQSNANQEQKPLARTPLTPVSSLFLKSVILYDWWLARADGKGLAVAGFADKKQGARVFCSAAISRRINTNTLETIDCIKITVTGLINRFRTLQNGFSLEVCSHFLLGFPYYWKDYATWSCVEESSKEDVPARKSGHQINSVSSGAGSSTSPSVSIDDLPARRISDFFLRLDSNIFSLDHILQNFCSTTSKHTQAAAQSEDESESSKACKKAKPNQKKSNTDVQSDSASDKFTNSSTGVVTRSMSRLRKLGTVEERGSSSYIVDCKDLRKKPSKKPPPTPSSKGRMENPSQMNVLHIFTLQS